jgi:hypothetical protein
MSPDAVVPTTGDVRRIAAVSDPITRNLQITQAYHGLACALAALTGPGANWCTIATWASRQAGQSIRREDLSRAFERLLRGSSAAAQQAQSLALAGAAAGSPAPPAEQDLIGAVSILGDALSPLAVFERTADAVARGNRKVFEEIGYEFARFLALFSDGRVEDVRLDAFCEELHPGDPPDGQQLLRDAFTHYHRALTAAADQRPQWLLLANLEIGFHEQTRLQPEIIEAMNAPVVDPRLLRRRLIEELFPDPASRLRYILAALAGKAQSLIENRDRLAAEAQRLGRLAITDHMMTLDLPGGHTVRLGDDLGRNYPASLQHITVPELAALLAQAASAVDRTPGGASGVEDWGSLPDRMHFIADLFRVYHFVPELFDPPFTDEQTAVIVSGGLPSGRL